MAKRRPPRCDIVVLVDEETGDYRGNGRFEVAAASVEKSVLTGLRAGRERVEVVPFDPRVTPTIERLRALGPRLVLNLTEWVDGDRSQDAAIAGLLDMMGLAYTGSGPDGMRLARDKALSKVIAASLGVAVPRHFALGRGARIRNPGVPYPLIVKPQLDDGSVGITLKSLVRDDRALRAQVRRMRGLSDGPLVCEAFVPGRDLFVGVIGNEPRVLPAIELVFGKHGPSMPRFMTYRVKHDTRYSLRWKAGYRLPRLAPAVVSAIDAASRDIFHALKLRDYARIDYRLTPDGTLYFIEANPNPDLSPHAFGRNRCFAGMRYPALLRNIIAAARKRYGIRP
jgi:D-alanine-D-alanine ligase